MGIILESQTIKGWILDKAEEGTLVFIKNRKPENKLDKKFIVPYIVIKNKLKEAYEMQSIEIGVTQQISRKDFLVFKENEEESNIELVLVNRHALNEGGRLSPVTVNVQIIRLKVKHKDMKLTPETQQASERSQNYIKNFY